MLIPSTIFYMMLLTTTRGESNTEDVYYKPETPTPISYVYLPPTKLSTYDKKQSHHQDISSGHHDPHSLVTRPSDASIIGLHHLVYENPLLAALLFSTALGVQPIKHQGSNLPDQVPVNPYISLLLSQYGRYVPVHHLRSKGNKGLYYYAASNNYHNNKPFGAYKVYEEAK